MTPIAGLVNDNNPPMTPLAKYRPRKRRPPSRASSRGPKKKSANMLKKMCPSPPCRNM